jgi:hypothetical protein
VPRVFIDSNYVRNNTILINLKRRMLMASLHAIFERMIDGRKAVEELKKLGCKAHLDLVDNYLHEYSEEINFAGATNAPSLSALVLKSDGHITSIDKGPLVASSPIVSGLGSYRDMESPGTRLIVKFEEGKDEEIKSIIRNLGGSV